MNENPESNREPFTIFLLVSINASMSVWVKFREMGDLDVITEMTDGLARVCRNAKEIDQFQDGENLAVPITFPS